LEQNHYRQRTRDILNFSGLTNGRKPAHRRVKLDMARLEVHELRLPKQVVRIANAVTKLAIYLGIPRPPYTRKNALVVETVGRRSGKRRRLPVGYLDDGGHIIVVVEDGARADWVRNALANGGRLRVHLRGAWRPARLKILDADPESYLRRMGRVHASFVRLESTTPAVVKILPE
jgi:deazaflavin-dependent oxidoreductase (nitroreductase family)